MDLSVLVCSTHTRFETFGQEIQRQIWSQYHELPPQYQERVEILMFTDNKKMVLGRKRNAMVDTAQGRYVVFIDDDDRIEPDMLFTLLNATLSDADVITFLASVTVNGENPKICHYSIRYKEDRDTEEKYERLPNHICCVKREISKKARFPELSCGEDTVYSKRLREYLRTEFHIDRVLYHYDYNDSLTETQREVSKLYHPVPIVDVVMFSDASSMKLQVMTQNAVNTCVAGANLLPVNVIVIEKQEDIQYQNALTIPAVGEFHYNKYANRGARYGEAEWIMIANNDLIFESGWLHHLLAAQHPAVSPKSPRDGRQYDITVNTTGYVNGTHFSGWCFMIKRKLWEEMGGFDTSVTFWCSDDVVIQQLKELDVQPMLVPYSVVHHLGSKTLSDKPDRGELTWAQVKYYNEKYGDKLFENDPRLLKWEEALEL